MKDISSPVLVPMLYMSDLAAAIDYYGKAFGAKERWRIGHEGKVHVAELDIEGTLFRLHDETPKAHELGPTALNGTTVVIHLLSPRADELMDQAIAAGAVMVSPMKDYEYGYRQGNLKDPFGHHWCIERMDDLYKVPKV